MNLKDYNPKNKPSKLEKIDEIFLDKLNLLIKDSTKNFKEYEYSKAKLDTEKFFWSDFCKYSKSLVDMQNSLYGNHIQKNNTLASARILLSNGMDTKPNKMQQSH